ncbi:MAG TPA: UDP-N-acetylmuramoyl-tripeptide--D-alanyl-D-alanine ligase [bacterium]|nr:UDP-N-acetylmuramoyl-tripeptide--D-alanyl-D-alanine ligase [bacterium]
MNKLTVRDILEAVGGRLVSGDPSAAVASLSTDTRTIREGELFVPISGKNFDGHDFIDTAISRGASGFFCGRGWVGARAFPPGMVIVEVDDTLAAYGDVARRFRLGFQGLTVIAVTGSNGKTTTKDMIARVMEGKRRVHKTAGTLNNFVGLPRMMLQLTEGTDVAVLELGMSALGEIDRLSRAAVPDIAVITNIGYSHIEFLGSIENVARGKAEILNGLKPNGTVVLNADDRFSQQIAAQAEGRRIVTFGLQSAADYHASAITMGAHDISFDMAVRGEDDRCRVTAPVIGHHNVYNILATAAACHAAGLSIPEIAAGIAGLKLPSMRLEVSSAGGVAIINDAYNANPSSLRAGLDTLTHMPCPGVKVFVLGDMLELGDFSAKAHANAGRAVAHTDIMLFVTVGAQAALAAEAARRAGRKDLEVVSCETKQEVVDLLGARLRGGDMLMVKGSRGNKLEEVVTALSRKLSGAGAGTEKPAKE